MTRFSRRSMIASTGSLFSALSIARFPSGAAEFTYKLGTDVPLASPLSARALEASVKIFRETGGRLDIKVYPNSVLGSDPEMVEQVRIGALEFLLTGNSIFSNVVPVAGIEGTPFIFANNEACWAAADGPLGRYIRAAIAKTGMYPFEKTWDSSLRQIFNNVRPIQTPDDVRGLKIRTPPSPVAVALFRALGASPTPLAINTVYTSLQTKLIDGVELAYYIIEDFKYYEILKYGATTNHIWSDVSMVASGTPWQRLPKTLRDLVDRNFNEAALRERADQTRSNRSNIAQLTSQGIAFTQPDIAAFRAAARRGGVYSTLRSTYGDEAWSVLEKAVGPLG